MCPRCRADRGIDPLPGKRQGVSSSEHRHRARPIHHARPRGHGLDHPLVFRRHCQRGFLVRRGRTLCRLAGSLAAGHPGRVATGRRVVRTGAPEDAGHRPVGRHRHRCGHSRRDCARFVHNMTLAVGGSCRPGTMLRLPLAMMRSRFISSQRPLSCGLFRSLGRGGWPQPPARSPKHSHRTAGPAVPTGSNSAEVHKLRATGIRSRSITTALPPQRRSDQHHRCPGCARL